MEQARERILDRLLGASLGSGIVLKGVVPKSVACAEKFGCRRKVRGGKATQPVLSLAARRNPLAAQDIARYANYRLLKFIGAI